MASKGCRTILLETCLLLSALLAWGVTSPSHVRAQTDNPPEERELVSLDHPVFALLPGSGPLEAGSPATLWALLVDTDGLPVDKDVSISVKVDRGHIERFEQRKPGLYEVRLIPPPDSDNRPVAIEFRAVVDGVPVNQTFALPIRVPAKASLELSLAVRQLKLGRRHEVPFVVRGVRPDGLPIEAGDLVIRTNVGEVHRLRTIRPGRVEGVFVPTGIKTPLCVILAAFVGQGEDQVVAWRSIRIIGTPRIPVTTEPGSQAWVEVGSRRFGPVKVGSSGKVLIPVAVPPGISSVVVNARDAAGNTTRYSVNLSIPPFPRALLHIDREVYRVDETRPLVLTLILVEEDGSPSPLIQTAISATGGRLGGLVEVAPGTFRTVYSPPPEAGRHEVRVTVPLPGGTEQAYAAPVEVQVGIPARVALSVTPSSMRADDPPAEVSLKVFDTAGNPAPGVSPRAEVDFGTIGAFRSIGPGEYVAAYRARQILDAVERDASGMVRAKIRAWVDRLASDGPAVALSIVPDRMIVDGGGEPVTLTVTALDPWGAPVRGVPLTATVEHGDGDISRPQVTDVRGRADFLYRPGRSLGPVTVRVQSDKGGLEARTLLLQAGPGPVDPEFIDLLSELQGNPNLVLSAETEIVVRAGFVKKLQISAMPSFVYTGRGQSSRLRIRLEDYSGNAVVDPSIQVTADMGSVSDVRFTSDGVYTARYTPPVIARAAAVDIVHVTNPDGEYSGSTEIQVFRREGKVLAAVRLGYVSNFGAIGSPVVDLQGLLRVPRTKPDLYAGISASYYSFSAEGTTTIRYDLFPLHLFACLRSQTGRFTPYGGAGPILGLALVGTPLPTSYLPGSSAETIGETDVQSIASQWQMVRALGVFPGFGALLGLEVGLGPGGMSIEAAISWIKGRNVLDDLVGGTDNLGGLVLRAGYVAHF